MTQENKCDITGGYYSVIHICERCGCRYARHVGNDHHCKTCIAEIEKKINKNFMFKAVIPTIMALLMICIIPVIGGDYDWVRPPSDGNIEYINNTNITNIYNYYNADFSNMTGNCPDNNYVFGFLPNISKVCLPLPNDTIFSFIAGDNIIIKNITGGTTNNVTINSTGRSIQTFKGADMAFSTDVSGSRWQYTIFNGSSNTPKATPWFNYSFTSNIMQENFGYWDFGYTMTGSDKNYINLVMGVPFRRLDKANAVDISVRFKANGGSTIGYPCPNKPNTPENYMQNVTIILNRADGVNATSKLFNFNATMFNYTIIQLKNISMDIVAPSSNPDAMNWYASVVYKEKSSGQSGAAIGICIDLADISIEQYYRP
jgi:hypothetical protein